MSLKDQYFHAVLSLNALRLSDLAPGLSKIFGNRWDQTLTRSTDPFWKGIRDAQFCKALDFLGVPLKESKSIYPLLGKVVGTWKRMKEADTCQERYIWHDIESVLRHMIKSDAHYGITWFELLPQASEPELKNMLEFLENLK